ncbi:MAG: hypothetical protein ACQESJ_10155, partial [Bacteroidota bacterium]
LENRISAMQSKIEEAPDETADSYRKSYSKMRKEYSELQSLISDWCRNSPGFCFFLEPFGN